MNNMEKLTKLDLFALSAMQAIMSNPNIYPEEITDENLALNSYVIAEKMIRESEKRQPKQEK